MNFKYFFSLLAIIILGSSCNDRNPDQEDAALKAKKDSLLQLALKEKKAESDNAIIKRILRMENKKFGSNPDTIFYEAQLFRSPDSVVTAVNLKGKTSSTGKVTQFQRSLLMEDDDPIKEMVAGHIFRIDRKEKDQYFLYASANREIQTYLLKINGTKSELENTSNAGNFYFNLLSKTVFTNDISDKYKFFKIRKDQLADTTSEISILSQDQKIYEIRKPFFNRETPLNIHSYYFVSDSLLLEKLIIRDNDSLFGQMILSGEKTIPNGKISYTGTFVNDSIYKLNEVKEVLTKDNRHLVQYEVDSTITTYLYDKTFTFVTRETEAHFFKRSYPQYYPSLADSSFMLKSKPFNMNGIPAAWNYLVRYSKSTNKNSEDVKVVVNNKDLINLRDGSLIFRAPQLVSVSRIKSISEIADQDYSMEEFDINFDGSKDLYFENGTDTNGNKKFLFYLYEKSSGRFVRKSELSGTSLFRNVILDTVNKSILYSGKTGRNDYSATILQIASNDSITGKEIIWSSSNGKNIDLHYQKMEGNKIVEKKDNLTPEITWDPKNFKQEFMNWILENKGSLSQ